MMNNKSPLRYPGGKTRACKIIEGVLTKYIDIPPTLVSPFFGGGSFEFYLQNKYNLDIIANDKFIPLYQLWLSAKNNKKELCTLIDSLHPATKEQFATYRENIMKETNPLKQAAWYFIINRCSFSGATLSGGFSKQAAEKRFTKSSIQRLKNVDLSKTTFSNDDFTDFIPRYKNHFMFLDPPYYLEKKSKLYGKNGDLHESFDHKKLASLLKEVPTWILCYNDCTYIRKLYEGYTIVEVNWNYGMNKSKKSSEILIHNSKKVKKLN